MKSAAIGGDILVAGGSFATVSSSACLMWFSDKRALLLHPHPPFYSLRSLGGCHGTRLAAWVEVCGIGFKR